MVYGYYYRCIARQYFKDAEGYPMVLEIHCKLNHIMFIPMWPGKKMALVKSEITGGQYPPDAYDMEDDAIRLLNSTSPPWYSYIGTVLLLGFIGLFASLIFSSEKEKTSKLERQLDKLYAGQILVYKTDGDKYTSCYVDSVSSDSIWVYQNKMESNKRSISNIEHPENYSTVRSTYTRTELQDMLANDILIRIEYGSSAYILKDVDFSTVKDCVLYYELPDGNYSSVKVDSISGDLVYVRKNRATMDRKDNFKEINKPENYSDTTSVMLYRDIDQMTRREIIYSIHID